MTEKSLVFINLIKESIKLVRENVNAGITSDNDVKNWLEGRRKLSGLIKKAEAELFKIEFEKALTDGGDVKYIGRSIDDIRDGKLIKYDETPGYYYPIYIRSNTNKKIVERESCQVYSSSSIPFDTFQLIPFGLDHSLCKMYNYSRIPKTWRKYI